MNPTRRKVLFIIPFLGEGGAERVLLILLNGLDRASFEPHLAVLQSHGELIGRVPNDVVIHDLKVSKVRYALPSIVRVVWKVRPRTILSTLPHLNLALLLTKPFLPRTTKLLIRETVIASTFFFQEKRYPQVWGWLYRRFYKRADRIICLSDSMLDNLVEHFGLPREKMIRIYNPVDVKSVRKLAEAGDNPYSGSGPHLVAIGRLCRQKGFDLLIRAMPVVLGRFPTSSLTILGEGPLRNSLIEQTIALGLSRSVRFVGFQSNPWTYLKHAHLFVLPSRYEGLPNALLEALTLGVPAVASDCPGGIREIASCSGDVLLVENENVESLAKGILSMGIARNGINREGDEEETLPAKFGLQVALSEYTSVLSA
jgi:glycosyltransferase involved in cell wall biosynthesis